MEAKTSMVKILDGGMGGEIQRRLPNAAQGLWSATALLEDPDLVVNLHREYIEAGAEIITTNTYSTIPSYLAKADLAHRGKELTGLASRLARQAADQSQRAVRVAGSLPPLSESYRADLVQGSEESSPVYEEMALAMAGDVDLYLCETMSSADEAFHAATQACRHGNGKPVYVSWTLDETPGAGLRSGETIAAAHARLDGLPVAGFLFNCTRPEPIVAALSELSALTTLPLGAYPNRMDVIPEGWTLDNDLDPEMNLDLSTQAYVAAMQRCIEAGASIVGGCCGIGPADIAALAGALQGTGKN